MSEPIRIADDGYVEVQYKGVTLTLDLYDAYCRLEAARLGGGAGEPAIAVAGRYADVAEGLGLPRPSCQAALEFAEAIYGRVAAVKKKPAPAAPPSPSPDCPAGTASSAAASRRRKG